MHHKCNTPVKGRPAQRRSASPLTPRRWVNRERGSLISELFRTTAQSAPSVETARPRRRIVVTTMAFATIDPAPSCKVSKSSDGEAVAAGIALETHPIARRRLTPRPGIHLVAA